MAQYRIKGLANTPQSPSGGYRIKGLAQQPEEQEDPMVQTPQSQGISSIPGDVGNAVMDLGMAAGNKAMRIPDELSAAGSQIAENPVGGTARAGGSVLSGLLEGGKQVFNLPFNLAGYLGRKGIPGFSSGFPYADSPRTLGEFAEGLKIGDTGLQKKVMGEAKPGDELFEDVGELAGLFVAPEAAGAKIPAVSSKGILKQLSKEKAKQLGIAKTEYGSLFKQAGEQGLTHAAPSKTVIKTQADIIKNSQPKFHTSLKKYLAEPTLENAHWAQSELGALERHLDSISKKTGLTPSQIKTYKNVVDAKKSIKESMFSKNALGANPKFGSEYEALANKYRENVIPYTRLEELSEVEAKRMRPKSAVKSLLNDEQFMIDLAKKNPGVYLHTPAASKLKWGAAGLLGYDELKKLLR